MSVEILLLLSPLIITLLITAILGWSHVPDDTRFRGRLGPTGMDFTVGKGTGFGMRLATGFMAYFGAAVLGGGKGSSTGLALFLGAVSLVVLLIGQISAIRRATPR